MIGLVLGEEYAQTYRRLGGRDLEADSVRQAVTACFEAMSQTYEDAVVRRQLFLPMSDNYFCRWSPG
jgi:hypothetical protein